MSGSTTLLKYIKPTVSGDADVWGGYLNTNFDSIDKLQNAVTTTGSANAYVLTTGQTLTAYATGQSFLIKPNFTNSGAATLNVDGIGAKNIYRNVAGAVGALVSGDMVSGIPVRVVYDGTQFVADLFQPKDATLDAVAALSYTSGTLFLTLTAADTFTLVASTTLVHTTGTETVAGAKTFTSAAVINTNSGTLPTALSGVVLQLGAADTVTTQVEIDAFAAIPGVAYRRANGTAASPSALALADVIGQFQWRGYGATGYSSTARAFLRGLALENWTDSAQGVYLSISTTRAGSTTNTERYQAGAILSNLEIGYRDGGPGGNGGTPPDATYTFTIEDRGTPTDHTSGSAHTYTVPPASSVAWPANAILFGTNFGAGVLTIARGAGVTFRDAAGTNADLTVNQYQSYMVRRHPTTADTFTVRVT